MRTTSALAIFSLSLISLCAQAADDPQIGHWKLDLARSKYFTAPRPKSAEVAITPYGTDGVTVSAHTLNAAGQEFRIQYSAQYDGKAYPRTETGAGAVAGQTVKLRRIGPRSAERVTFLGSKPVGTERWVISVDGKTRTVTQFGVDLHGKSIKNLLVYEKQ